MAYPLEFDRGFQMLIQIHTVNKIEKQHRGYWFFFPLCRCLEKKTGKKIKCNDAELDFNSIMDVIGEKRKSRVILILL